MVKAAMFAASPDSDYLARWWLLLDEKPKEVERICMEAGAAFQSVNAYAKCIPTDLTVDRFFAALDHILAAGNKEVEGALEVVREIIRNDKPETVSDLSFLVTHRTFETPDESGIHIGTIHSAKGLEWPMVWLPSCNQGYLPGKDVEEDRRLFFVAVTRARDWLKVSWTKERKKYPMATRPDPAEPSQFIAEMKGTPC
jgi:superfamily I DNA/RNA helicase